METEKSNFYAVDNYFEEVSTGNRGLWVQIKNNLPIHQNIKAKHFINELTAKRKACVIFTP